MLQMTFILKAVRYLLLCCALLALSGSLIHVDAKKRKHSKRPAHQSVEPPFDGVRIKLADGTFKQVDDAWESEQGIWYRQGGVTNLLTKDRAKGIQRSTASPQPEVESQDPQEPQVAALQESTVAQTPTEPDERPAWIFLKGGAKFEADTATESVAGVWYRRGPMSVFIERSRIDHIEREDPALAKVGSRERAWSTGNLKIDGLIRQNGAKYGVDPYLIFCVMEQESHFNPRALSPKGARGLMQLMPGTGARFGVRRPHDPAQNIAGGTRYLKQLLTQFNGRVDLVLASYNAGEGAVMKYGRRVPPYKETRDYVKRISYRYRRAKPLAATKNKVAVSGSNSTAR